MSRAIRYVLSGILTIVFLIVAFKGTDPSTLWESMREVDYTWMALSFGCLMFSHLFRALRWRYLLDPVKPGIGLRNLFSGVMIGYLFNNILPRAGEFARPYAIARLESLPTSAAFGTIVIERVIDGVTFLILLAMLPLLYSGPLLETFPWLIPSGIVGSVVIVFSLAALVALTIRRDWTDVLLRKATHILPERFNRKLSGAAHAFLDGFLFLTRPAHFLTIGILSFLVWFLYAVMTYFSIIAFHLESVLNFLAATVVLTISSVGIALPTPGGIGSYHVLTVQSLVKLFGVDPSVALGFAAVTHAVSFIGVSIVGLYFAWHDNVRMTETVGRKADE